MRLLATAALCLATASLSAQSKAGTILPAAFAGWEKAETATSRRFTGDQQHAAAMSEYGMSIGEVASYKRQDRRLKVTAIEFPDATGAYGAFTYFRTPQMADDKICDEAASERTHVIFYCSNVFVDVQLDRVTAMTLADLRALAGAITRIEGPAAQSPHTPQYLPEYARKNVVFALGPHGFARARSALPAEMVDFSRNPEIAVGRFESDSGVATATVIRYPTPAIAIQQQRRIEDWARTRPQAADKLNTAELKRSGPLVAFVGGEITSAEARQVLDRIGYDAEISWTEPTQPSNKDNIGNIVFVALSIAIIIFGASVIAGIIFGGFRMVLRKLFPNRFHDPGEQGEFIRLKLED